MNKPMPDTNEPEERRVAHLLALTGRISEALAADIAAIEAGALKELRSADPEIERLCALYGREVASLKMSGRISAQTSGASQLKENAAKLTELLKRHQTLVAAMRSASEGLVQAVAKEVQKSRESTAPYRPAAKAKPSPASAGAIVYNRVI